MRSKILNKIHFDYFLNNEERHYQELKESKSPNFGTWNRRYYVLFRTKMEILIAKYSSGFSVEDLKAELYEAVDWRFKVEQPNLPRDRKGNTVNEYYPEEYYYLNWALSIGVLLNVDKSVFERFEAMFLKDGVVDFLLFFLTKNALKKDTSNIVETYDPKYLYLPKLWSLEREMATNEMDEDLEKRLKHYCQKTYHYTHRNSFWYNSHKINGGMSFFGYWTFCIAAITKLYGLNDSSFSGGQYYPKDLADYYDSVN